MTSRGDSGCAGCRDTSWDWPSLSTAPSSLAAVLGRAGEQCRSTTAGEARAGCCTSGCIVTSKQQRHTTVAAATCAANAGLQRSFVGNCCFGACEQQLIAGAAARTTASGSGSFHTFQIHCSCSNLVLIGTLRSQQPCPSASSGRGATQACRSGGGPAVGTSSLLPRAPALPVLLRWSSLDCTYWFLSLAWDGQREQRGTAQRISCPADKRGATCGEVLGGLTRGGETSDK